MIKVEEVRLLEMSWIGNVNASSVVLAQFAVVEYSSGVRCPESEFGFSASSSYSFRDSHMKFKERH